MKNYLFTAAVFVLLIVAVSVGACLQLKLGFQLLSAWGSYLQGWGTLALAFAAFYGATQAVREYKSRSETERAKWLSDLFHRFYEENRYAITRQKIDFEDIEDMLGLIEKDKNPGADFSLQERNLFDALTDYLNFFEYIAYLRAQEQLTDDDIDAMFDYYLRRFDEIQRSKELRQYIKDSGFENLSKLLEYRSKARGS